MYFARRRVSWGNNPHLSGESLWLLILKLVLVQLKMHQVKWMVYLSPLGFSRFHSGFHMLLSQNHCTLNIAFIGKGERKNFLMHQWGLSVLNPSGLVCQVPRARSRMPDTKFRAKETLPSNDLDI